MALHLKYSVFILISVFFFVFGIHVLVAAYRLNDPYAFILTFFASNFIILISAALALGLILRWRHLRLTAPGVAQAEMESTTGSTAEPPDEVHDNR